MSWTETIFGNFVQVNPRVDLERGTDYSFIPMEIIEPDNKFITAKNERTFTGGGARFSNGDTIFARITPCLEHGKIAKVKGLSTNDGFGSTEYFVFRAIPDKSDPDFVYYLSKSATIKEPAIKSMVGSSGRQRADKNVVAGLKIHVPNIIQQKRIADVFNGYDDLIENNLRRIELLENAARLIYKEWFVKLNFPGREHTKIVDGLPEGWHMGTVGELASVQSGYAFKSLDWQTDGNPVIKIKNIDNNTIDIINCDCVPDMIAEKAIKFKLSAGDLLIAMTGATIGKIGIMPRTNQPYYLNQRVGLFKSKHESIDIIPFLFVLFNTENAQSQIVNFAAGAAQPNISGGQIEAVKTIISPDKILKMFSEYVVPILNQREILAAQNEQLKKARDILLPKLMTGEIAV
jgi:type I restriction enzyme S subunit